MFKYRYKLYPIGIILLLALCAMFYSFLLKAVVGVCAVAGIYWIVKSIIAEIRESQKD